MYKKKRGFLKKLEDFYVLQDAEYEKFPCLATRCVSGFFSCAYLPLPFVNSLRSDRTTEGTASTHKISEASLSHWTGELLTPTDCENMKNPMRGERMKNPRTHRIIYYKITSS